jgi:hypothetical protein
VGQLRAAVEQRALQVAVTANARQVLDLVASLLGLDQAIGADETARQQRKDEVEFEVLASGRHLLAGLHEVVSGAGVAAMHRLALRVRNQVKEVVAR